MNYSRTRRLWETSGKLPLSIMNKLAPVCLKPSGENLNNRLIDFCYTLILVRHGEDEDDAGT